MKPMIWIPMIAMLFSTGCDPSASREALCAGTKTDRRAHAAALIEDGGPVSQASGAVLLSKMKAGCNE